MNHLNNRRELSRQYKQNPPPTGVYAIRNLQNQRVFVGGSTNVQGSLNRARMELGTGQHRNARLLADWRVCGAHSFCFEVLDVVKPKDDPAFDMRAELAGMVEMWREELQAYGESSGYNTRQAGGAP